LKLKSYVDNPTCRPADLNVADWGTSKLELKFCLERKRKFRIVNIPGVRAITVATHRGGKSGAGCAGAGCAIYYDASFGFRPDKFIRDRKIIEKPNLDQTKRRTPRHIESIIDPNSRYQYRSDEHTTFCANNITEPPPRHRLSDAA
jgi:hypothetical protein